MTLDFREGRIGGAEPGLATELRNAALECEEEAHYVLTFANEVYGYVNAVFINGTKCVELRLPFNGDGTSPLGVPPFLAAEGDHCQRMICLLQQSEAPVGTIHQFLLSFPETAICLLQQSQAPVGTTHQFLLSFPETVHTDERTEDVATL